MRTPCSKKKRSEKGREKRSNFDGVVPVDLVIEIIRRLPPKSIARLLLVSKLLASIIRSREFITSFSFGISSKPRLLVAFVNSDRPSKHQNWYFFSLMPWPSSTSKLSASFLSRVTCPFLVDETTSHYVNGLVSFAYGQEQVIANPSIGKPLSLPRVKNTKRSRFTIRFFGYDSVDDQYKVLCMTHRKGPSSQHQVFTLGAEKEESWRKIDCSVPHSPWSTSVCIDGVLYYVAKTGTNLWQRSLMRFDLRSEKLELFTSLSSDIEALNLKGYDLINYQGKVATLISTQTRVYTQPILAAWVMDQNAEKHEWLKKITFNIEHLMNSHQLRITGSTHTGEFILAPSDYVDGFYVILYNLHTKRFRRFGVKANAAYDFLRGGNTRALVFPNYVKSVRLL